MLTVRQATPQDQQSWDNYIHQHPQATPYHLFAWGQSVLEAYHYQTSYFLAETENNVVGVLPGIILSIPLKGKTICSLPYCDQAGILADNANIADLLLKQVMAFAAEQGIKKVELRQSIAPETVSTDQDPKDLSGKKFRMILPLPSTSTELLKNFKSKLRSQINKSIKNGLTATVMRANINKSLIDNFYTVLTQNMRALGSPVHSKKWYESITKYYQNDAIIAVVYLDKIAVGAGIVITIGNKASIPWASTLQDYNSLSPNMLLYWSLLEYCSDHGITEFDFGRSTFGEGTYQFKKQWGTLPRQLNWQEYQQGQLKPESTDSNNPNTIRPIIEAVWKRTPLWVTNYLGPKLRKYISL
jgi:FemAB-related protein (PEP-CTERM system-associated)